MILLESSHYNSFDAVEAMYECLLPKKKNSYECSEDKETAVCYSMLLFLYQGCRYEDDVQYPTSSGTFNKEPDYILGLQQDLDRLIQQEFLEHSHTPSYVSRIGQETGPSRECFLFTRKLVASSKVEQQLEKSNPPRPTTAPPPSARTRFVKTNDRHQYLTATDSGRAGDEKHGRPTRTTLLRARHRINSAPPVNSYEDRCSHRGAQSDRPSSSSSKRPTSASSVTSSVESVHDEIVKRKVGLDGETVHQFLIGARYNTAHYVDRKAIERYGVYMPRHSPGQFFTRTEATRGSTPGSRPGSPMEAWNSSINPSSTRPTSAGSTSLGAPSTARPPTPAAESSESVLTTLAPPENLDETSQSAPILQVPLSVRGSRISAAKPSSHPAPTPLGSVASGLDKRASPRPAIAVRSPSPLPHVVGLSLGAAARGRAQATMRTRRVIVTARFGGSTVGSASAAAQRRAGGVAAADITRAFSIRPWRDTRSLRQTIIEHATKEKPVEVPALSLEEDKSNEALVQIEDLEIPNV